MAPKPVSLCKMAMLLLFENYGSLSVSTCGEIRDESLENNFLDVKAAAVIHPKNHCHYCTWLNWKWMWSNICPQDYLAKILMLRKSLICFYEVNCIPLNQSRWWWSCVPSLQIQWNFIKDKCCRQQLQRKIFSRCLMAPFKTKCSRRKFCGWDSWVVFAVQLDLDVEVIAVEIDLRIIMTLTIKERMSCLYFGHSEGTNPNRK